MKTYTSEEISTATGKAYRIVYNRGRALYKGGNIGKTTKFLDMRTRIGWLTKAKIYELEKAYDYRTHKEKVTERAKNKAGEEFKNIYNKPLVKDYMANKHMIKYIGETHMTFYGGRNHFAKNESDTKILKILKKHF